VKFDRYSLCARVLPAAFVVVPLVLSLLPWLPPETFAAKGPTGWTLRVVTSGAVAAALSFMLAQLSRGLGGRLEARLWRGWGGRPSVVFLRHRHPGLGTRQKRDLHKRLRRANPQLHLPSPEEETTDPVEADHCYERASAWLRNRTRESKAFPLLFEDNLSYGFRRNLLALRSYAVGSAIVGAASGLTAFFVVGGGWLVAVISIAAGAYALANDEGDLQRQSDKFTRSLFDALDTIDAPRPDKRRRAGGAAARDGTGSRRADIQGEPR
jgi:hypothetical protein